MKFLNVGALEFLFILLLALIILGPRKTVQTVGEIGRWIKDLFQSEFWRDLQQTTREIQDLPRKVMDEAEIQKTIEELDRSEAARQRGLGNKKLADRETHSEDPHNIQDDPLDEQE
jgi:Sec-independent protein translocase protein TatA